MEQLIGNLGWFALTVVPLILTPGPDILLVMSQGLALDRKAVLKAVNGISLGYGAHAILAAVGIAALISASPFLFGLLKMAGVLYLAYLATSMIGRHFRAPSQRRCKRPKS
ncbi:LysE family transporter [Ruegeria sp. ANG-R]|uniref:LysE family translocator n=1 Tax=Ruegeria sp. ANG-R TaxID=1577903 RepID=UPI00068F68B9|nr:LysE family transporter [Ruegeria sp. ANG-R]